MIPAIRLETGQEGRKRLPIDRQRHVDDRP